MNAERRLAAILAADVVGYSRLMEADEDGTLSALAELRSEVIEPSIALRNGRIVKLMGDGYLAEFASVVDSVETGIAIQTSLFEQAADRPADRRILLRVGINLGDVVIEDGDVFGTGVNLAARLEAMAPPGGVCISGAVHDQIRGHLDQSWTDLGAQKVKNIEAPVRVFMLAPETHLETATTAAERGNARPKLKVFPITGAGGEDGGFAAGLTEEIVTALSRTKWYDVVLPSPAGGAPAEFRLEGSLRSAGDRVRISVQLSDTATGTRIWADRFDRAKDDAFAVQDEIAQRIASILDERIWQRVAQETGRKRAGSYSANDLAFRGIELLHRLDPDEVEKAKALLRQALARDPDHYVARLGLGFCHLSATFWSDAEGTEIDRAYEQALAVRALDPDSAHTYRLLSRAYHGKGEFDESWECVQRALRIDPHDGDIIGNRGVYHLFKGEFDEALEWIGKVLEMHDDTPHTVDIMRYWRALALFGARDYAGSAAELGRITGLEFIKSELMAACLARLGRSGEAAEKANYLLERRPDLRLSDIRLWKSFRNEDDRQHFYLALRDAGLPA